MKLSRSQSSRPSWDGASRRCFGSAASRPICPHRRQSFVCSATQSKMQAKRSQSRRRRRPSSMLTPHLRPPPATTKRPSSARHGGNSTTSRPPTSTAGRSKPPSRPAQSGAASSQSSVPTASRSTLARRSARCLTTTTGSRPTSRPYRTSPTESADRTSSDSTNAPSWARLT